MKEERWFATILRCGGLNTVPPKFMSTQSFRLWPCLEIGSLQMQLVTHQDETTGWSWTLNSMTDRLMDRGQDTERQGRWQRQRLELYFHKQRKTKSDQKPEESRNDPLLEPSEGAWPPQPREKKPLLSKTTVFVVICYGSPRKSIHYREGSRGCLSWGK